MRKNIIAIVVAIASVCAVTLITTNEVIAKESNVEMSGAGDGHCTKCGLKNGRYRCPAFRPFKGRPTDCKCGHDKQSHAWRN